LRILKYQESGKRASFASYRQEDLLPVCFFDALSIRGMEYIY
jgi:hypothetical protein